MDRKKVDLALLMSSGEPFMFMEVKAERRGKSRAIVDPIDVSAVGQVMSYIAFYRKTKGFTVPFAAVATQDQIAVFKTPENIDEYLNENAMSEGNYREALKLEGYHRLIKEHVVRYENYQPKPEYFDKLLGELFKIHAERREQRLKLTDVLIERFREFVNVVSKAIAPLLLKNDDPELKETLGKLGVENVAKRMAYVLLNKLVFYKLLEQNYRLPLMTHIKSSSAAVFREDLEYYFGKAVEVTKDFEPIFNTGVFDKIPIPDDPGFMEYVNEFVNTLNAVAVEELIDYVGYIYEELIPPEERHQMGQFYTPPWVCELIVEWSIRGRDDLVLDPGSGSGGFLTKAYQKLVREKIGLTKIIPREVHESVIRQLYAIDIDPFAAHLTAVNIAAKNVRASSTELNVINQDFFSIKPSDAVLAPYVIKTAAGEVRRKINMPKFDAVVGNPPYTRWVEIPPRTQEFIKTILNKMKKYSLAPQVSRGIEPGIYVYWIMHATEFLKEGGRLGMIIPNTWLQTDYGVKFANFLLDHYKVKAIFDFKQKLFKDALVTTCILLAERESDEKKRAENDVVFVYVENVENLDPKELLEAVKSGKSEKYHVRVIKQKEIPRDRKWIELFFKKVDISNHPLVVKLGELFEPLRGNTVWAKYALSHGKRPDPGSSEFHYLSPSRVEEFRLGKYAYPNASLDEAKNEAIIYPAITSARQAKFFTFTEDDWKKLRNSDERCYMFIGHKPFDELPDEVKKYIEEGKRIETKIRGSRKGGRSADETEAAKARSKEKKWFYGWYDLGGVIPTPIFAIYQARYKTRFVWCKFPVAMYHALIALVPKNSLNEVQLKALLAYLNSSFAQYYIEIIGRKISVGPIALEVNQAREMPVLDVRKLTNEQLDTLAKLFDELEEEARKIGGASEKEHIDKLKPKIYKIDEAIGDILGLSADDVKIVQSQVEEMVRRRVGVRQLGMLKQD